MMKMDRKTMNNKERRLEEKGEKEYAEYRMKRVLEILLEADLRRLEELCQKEKEDSVRHRA